MVADKTLDPLAEIKAAAAVKTAIDPPEPSEGVSPQSMFRDAPSSEQNRDARLSDVIAGVMATQDIEVRSVLEDKHIVELVKGRIFAAHYKSVLMAQLCQFLHEARISKDGRGRKDLRDVMKAAVANPEETVNESRKHLGKLFS